MGIGITQGSKSIIVFLSRSIPKGQFDVFSIYFNVCDVIFKDGGHVDLLTIVSSQRTKKNPSSNARVGGRGRAGNKRCVVTGVWHLWEGPLGKDTMES